MTVLPYTAVELDRAGERRTDEQWLAALWADPTTRVIPMWQGDCLVADDEPVVVPGAEFAEVAAGQGNGAPVFLGLDADTALFALDLSWMDREAACARVGASGTADVRALFATASRVPANTLAYARGLCLWHREQRFCGRCGAETRPSNGVHLRACTGCAKLLFTRIEPAVITLIEAPGDAPRVLLARNSRGRHFGLVAGFVEIGESLEDAVRREAAEEVGAVLDSVTYLGSQGWPFPSGLMLGFHARATTEEFTVDGDEIAEARWVGREEFAEHAARFRSDSIETHLAASWLARHQ